MSATPPPPSPPASPVSGARSTATPRAPGVPPAGFGPSVGPTAAVRLSDSPGPSAVTVAARDPGELAAALAAALRGEEERKAVKRSRGRWRFFGVLTLLALAAGAAANYLNGLPGFGPSQDHIARIRVSDVITSSHPRDEFLRKIAEDESVKAVVLRLDSPGGTVVGSEELYESLRVVAEAKPLVAIVGEQAASGGYIAALAADRILARQNSITGSIGVISQTPNVHTLAQTIGMEMVEVKSSPLKAAPSPFQPVDARAIAADQAVVNDSYQWFLDLVKERRNMNENQARAVGDGRIFTGRMALEAGLIDEIGGEEEAVAWLEKEKGGAADLEVRRREMDSRRAKTLIERIGERVQALDSAVDRFSGRDGALWAIR